MANGIMWTNLHKSHYNKTMSFSLIKFYWHDCAIKSKNGTWLIMSIMTNHKSNIVCYDLMWYEL